MKPSVTYSNDPLIARYEQVATAQECQQLIELATNLLQPAKVIGQTEVVTSEFRKSDFAWLNHYANGVVNRICHRIASIVGHPLHYAENLQVARYKVGGKFGAHYDTYDLSTIAGRKFFDEGGQRLCTALLYLNSAHAGGETYFPELKLDIVPTEGSLLVFENCKKGTNETHPLSLHGSRELKEGEKWIATLWFREREQYPSPNIAFPNEKSAEPAVAAEKKAELQTQPVPNTPEAVKGVSNALITKGEKLTAKVVSKGSAGKREIHLRQFQIDTNTLAESDHYDQGPSPGELMLGALGSCITQTTLALATERGITLQYIEVEVSGEINSFDRWSTPCLHHISYKLSILSPDSTDTILKLHNAVARACPSLQLLVDPQTVTGGFVHMKSNS